MYPCIHVYVVYLRITSLSSLYRELSEIKSHDETLSQLAVQAQQNLAEALDQATKNAEWGNTDFDLWFYDPLVILAWFLVPGSTWSWLHFFVLCPHSVCLVNFSWPRVSIPVFSRSTTSCMSCKEIACRARWRCWLKRETSGGLTLSASLLRSVVRMSKPNQNKNVCVS